MRMIAASITREALTCPEATPAAMSDAVLQAKSFVSASCMENRAGFGIIGKRKLVDQRGKAKNQSEIEHDPIAPRGIELDPERPSIRVDDIGY
jgi:hypothetical protein